MFLSALQFILWSYLRHSGHDFGHTAKWNETNVRTAGIKMQPTVSHKLCPQKSAIEKQQI